MSLKQGKLKPARFAYLCALVLISAGLLRSALEAISSTPNELFPLAVLSLLLALIPAFFFLEQSPTTVSRSSPLIFLVVGSILLSPFSFLALVILFELIDALHDKLTRRGQISSPVERLVEGAVLNIAGASARWAFYLFVPAGTLSVSGANMLAAALAASCFLVLASVLSGTFAWLAGRRTLRQVWWLDRKRILQSILSGLFAIAILLFWNNGSWLVPLALAQFTLIYRGIQAADFRKQAQTDTKTGLWNARYFDLTLNAELNRSIRFKRAMAIVVADIDCFKDVNSLYGHLAGDQVLASIGQVVLENVRQYDTAGRFGGEEFVVVLPETGQVEAMHVAERLRRAVAEQPFWVPHLGRAVRVTMSLGVACYPEDASLPLNLVHAADLALYQAKAEGRNRVVAASGVLLTTDALPPVAEKWLANLASSSTNPNRRGELNVRSSHLLGRAFSRFNFASLQSTLIFGLAIVVIGFVLLNSATRDAVPGETLYPIKRTFEAVQIAIMVDDASRAQLYIALARTRLQEIRVLLVKGHYDLIPETVAAYTTHMQSATSTLSESKSTPENVVAIASDEVKVLADATNVLTTLLVSSPAETRAPIQQALDVNAANASIARTKLTQAMVMLVDLTPTPTSTGRPTQVHTLPSQTQTAAATNTLQTTATFAPSETVIVSQTPEPSATSLVPSATSIPTNVVLPTRTPSVVTPTPDATAATPTEIIVPPTDTPTATPTSPVQEPTKTPEAPLTPTPELPTSVPTTTATDTQVPTFTPIPTRKPTATEAPTERPSETWTTLPTDVPSDTPSVVPTDTPTDVPTEVPTETLAPTLTAIPSDTPMDIPTDVPMDMPTETFTPAPTTAPSDTPTNVATDVPTDTPTEVATAVPSDTATDVPTDVPTETATLVPTAVPSDTPTDIPTDTLTAIPTDVPTETPTDVPSDTPTETWTPKPLPTPNARHIETSTTVPSDTPQP